MFSGKNNTLKKAAAWASVSTAVLLCLIKGAAVFLTGSLSIMSSMVDSLSDILSSLITMAAVHFSVKPPSENHRYGYGKAESISAMIQAAFIVGSAVFIFYDGFDRLIHPQVVEKTDVGIVIMVISLIITLLLIGFQRYVIKKTNSTAIIADSAHYNVDVLSNAAVIVSLAVVHYIGWQWCDIVMALFISLYLLISGIKLAGQAVAEITDHEIDAEIKEKIVHLARSSEGVKGCHDLRTRVSGAQIFIEIHLEFDGRQSLYETHRLSDIVEQKIMRICPQAQVIVHQDPYGIRERRLDHEIKD